MSKKVPNSKKRNVKAKKEIEYADPNGQTYGIISRALGACRFEICCVDNIKRIGCIRGSIKKKMKIYSGDVVIVSLRDFQDEKCDIIHKYDTNDVIPLRNKGLIPESIKNSFDNDDDNMVFDFTDLAIDDDKLVDNL